MSEPIAEKPLPTVALTPEEVATMADYQQFLHAHGLERVLVCRGCGKTAEPGTGQIGWKCECRILVWRLH